MNKFINSIKAMFLENAKVLLVCYLVVLVAMLIFAIITGIGVSLVLSSIPYTIIAFIFFLLGSAVLTVICDWNA